MKTKGPFIEELFFSTAALLKRFDAKVLQRWICNGELLLVFGQDAFAVVEKTEAAAYLRARHVGGYDFCSEPSYRPTRYL